MKKRFDRRFFIVSIPTAIFLGLFGGVYLMISVRYGNFPENNYYFEGGMPTTWQFLTMYFYDIERMLTFSVIAVILAILFQILDDKFLGRRSWIMTAFALTALLSSMYFVKELIPAVSYDDEYLEIYLIELREEMVLFIGMYFLFSFILTALLRSIGVSSQHAHNTGSSHCDLARSVSRGKELAFVGRQLIEMRNHSVTTLDARGVNSLRKISLNPQ